MGRPIIGVLPLFDIERNSLWLIPGYMEALRQAGALPVMLPLTTAPADIRLIAESFNGFLFTGGQDIEPIFYDEKRSELCGESCLQRDTMEIMLFQEALKKDKPLLGICRGIQAFNVFCGGTLYQDIPSQKPSGTVHKQKPPYDAPAHDVEITEGTPLHSLLKKDRLSVNSCHHQTIKELSGRLEPMAWSEDGLIEAVYMPEMRFIWAVQWHPELSFEKDEDSRLIFEEFVRNCN